MLPPSFTPETMRQLELLRIKSRRAFLGMRQGNHLSLKRGHGIEFSDYRKYELGDNPRQIDWGVYARSDRLYIKRSQEEQDMSVLLALDGSASMGAPEGDNKWEMACDIVIAVAYVALMQRDSVLLSVLGQFDSPRCSGGSAIHKINGYLGGSAPKGQPDMTRALQQAVSRIRFPGIAVVISDFLYPLEEIFSGLNVLRAKNLEIIAVQLLSPHDIAPFDAQQHATFVDSETHKELSFSDTEQLRRDYETLLTEHTHQLRQFLTDSRIPYARAVSSQHVVEFVTQELAGTGIFV